MCRSITEAEAEELWDSIEKEEAYALLVRNANTLSHSKFPTHGNTLSDVNAHSPVDTLAYT